MRSEVLITEIYWKTHKKRRGLKRKFCDFIDDRLDSEPRHIVKRQKRDLTIDFEESKNVNLVELSHEMQIERDASYRRYSLINSFLQSLHFERFERKKCINP